MLESMWTHEQREEEESVTPLSIRPPIYCRAQQTVTGNERRECVAVLISFGIVLY